MSVAPEESLLARPRWWQQAAVSLWLSVCFVAVYNGCNYISSKRSDVGTCAFDWELGIFPFIPELIIAYWSIDLLYVIAPFLINRTHLLNQHLKRVSCGIVVAGVFFLLFPLELAVTRPAVTGWLEPFFSSLENFNNFYNCAPSLHIILRTNLWAIYVTPTKGAVRFLLSFWFLLIGASTLFCWQHHIMDVFTGQLVGLWCLWAFPSVPIQATEKSEAERVNRSNKIAQFYGLGGLLMLALTYWDWPRSMIGLWPTASLALVAYAYAHGGPEVFRKVAGEQLPSTRWLLNPYRWTAFATAAYFRRGQPAYGVLEDQIWVGRRLSQKEALGLDCRAVLDLTAEYQDPPAFLERDYLNVPILDLTNPSLDQLQQCVDFVKTHPSCYIHCSLGRGRSCTVAAAYLVARGLTVEQAISQVTLARPMINLPPGAKEMLARYQQWIQA